MNCRQLYRKMELSAVFYFRIFPSVNIVENQRKYMENSNFLSLTFGNREGTIELIGHAGDASYFMKM